MDPKKPRMKKEQQQLLLNSIMTNPEMINGNSQMPATKRLWADLTETLNGMGGVRKTQKYWLETYKLLARRAKAKLRTQRASMNRTGGGPPTEVKLTDLEKKTLSIEGTSTIYGLPGAIEAGIVIVPAAQPNLTPNVEENVIMVLDEIEEVLEEVPECKQEDTVIVEKHSDFGEAVSANASPATGRPTMVSQASSGCNSGATACERSVEGGVPHRTPRLRRRSRTAPRTLVPSADTTTPQEDAMIAALREGAQAQLALANAQIEAAQHLGACITRAATMIVEAMEVFKNK